MVAAVGTVVAPHPEAMVVEEVMEEEEEATKAAMAEEDTRAAMVKGDTNWVDSDAASYANPFF